MLANRVREFTTTLGTGDITLSGALAGHITFADAFSVGESVIYVVEDGDDYEIGTGTLVAADTLERTTVEETLVAGALTKTGAVAITLSGGARVYCAATAQFLLRPEIMTDVVSETTADVGVTVDGVLLKDGAGNFSGDVTVNGSIINNQSTADNLSLFRSNFANFVIGRSATEAWDIQDVSSELHFRQLVGGTPTNWLEVDTNRNATFSGDVTTSRIRTSLNGNAGAPSHSFSNDTSSGTYLIDTGQVGVSAGGTLALHLTDASATFSGDVVVENALPQVLLKDSDQSTGAEVSVNGQNGNLLLDVDKFNTGGNYFEVRKRGATALTIDGSNDVNIASGSLEVGGVGVIDSGRNFKAATLNVNNDAAIIHADGRAQFSGDVSLPTTGTPILTVGGNRGEVHIGVNAIKDDGTNMLLDAVRPLLVNNAATFSGDVSLDQELVFADQYSKIMNSSETATMYVSAGATADTGANIRMRGSSHGEAYDMSLRAGTTPWLHYDHSASEADFQGNDVTGVGDFTMSGDIWQSTTTGSFYISGSNNLDDGGNLVLYGSGHGSHANNVRFRTGTTIVAEWDDSASVWDFQGNNVTGVGRLTATEDVRGDRVKADFGTEALPSLTFTNQNNLGWYRAAGTTMGFSANGVTQLTLSDTEANFQDNAITTTGNIGIGVTPASKLHVVTTGSGIQDVAQIGNGQAKAAGIGAALGFGDEAGVRAAYIAGVWSGASDDNGYLSFYTRESDVLSEVLRLNNDGTADFQDNAITTTGKLGIGGAPATTFGFDGNGAHFQNNGATGLRLSDTSVTRTTEMYQSGTDFYIDAINSGTDFIFQPTGQVEVQTDISVTGDIKAGGMLNLGSPTELTISSGAITVTKSFHTVDTEGDAATDDLGTINGGSEGDTLILQTRDDARDVTLKHNIGNLRLAGDCTLASALDSIYLVFRGSTWREISRSNNA